MAERFLVQVDLDTLKSSTEGGLDLKTISYLDRVHTIVTPSNFEEANTFLKKHFNDFTTYCDATALEERFSDAVSLLDNGASKVFVTQFQFGAIVEDKLLADLSRLVVSLDHSLCTEEPVGAAKEIKDYIHTMAGNAAVGVAVHDVHDWTLLDVMERMAKDEGYPKRYVTLAYNTWDHYKKAVLSGHVPIVPAKQLTIEPKKYPYMIPAWLLITTAIQSDRPDGLFPTVVTDEHGVCLGLVYSNYESVEVALRSGSGVYWSRSRNKLWIKGAESGDTQELISIGWDCDADALQFTVRQRGDGNCIVHNASTVLLLNEYRFLPSKKSYLLWPLRWYGASGENSPRP